VKRAPCLLAAALLWVGSLSAGQSRIINPVTEVCWECLFPVTVGGVNVTPRHRESPKSRKRICICPGVPPKVGIPLTFWEPLRLVDVTRHAYCMVGLGGACLGKETVKNRGSVGIIGDGPSQSSFYHVHVYHFPFLSLLGLLLGFSCLDRDEVSVPYLSELDPTWKDDQLALILNPEASLFSSPLAQVACIADCATSSADHPNDELFWCAGCHGSLYPFTGTVAHHSNSLQASSLLVYRALAKLHRMGLVKGYGLDDFCEPRYMPIIRKSLYKTQLLRPVALTKGPCSPLGKSDLLCRGKKAVPSRDEEFCYLIWTKKQCCLDAIDPIVKGGLAR